MLRAGLLEGTTVIVTGSAEAVRTACEGLGADVHALAVDPFGEQPEVSIEAGDGLPVLVWDGAAAFAAAADPPSIDSTRAALDGAWLAIRAVAAALMLPPARGGKLLLLAPAPGTAHAEAARAGLENLARTLSIEWAQYGVRTVALLPGGATSPSQVGGLVAFLASRAGDYYSGCALTLR
jgi:hypothetical protein